MKKILVIDDDKDIADIVEIILKTRGFAVQTHYTGVGAEEMVDHYKPDLVLLDVMLPGKLGTEICRNLKEISNHPPILLFSAHAKEKDSLSICKADGFINKPFDVKNLLEKINYLTRMN